MLTLLLTLYLSFNFDNGSILELSDGSQWQIYPDDTKLTELWLTPLEIEIKKTNDKEYNYILDNISLKQQVRAKKL